MSFEFLNVKNFATTLSARGVTYPDVYRGDIYIYIHIYIYMYIICIYVCNDLGYVFLSTSISLTA